ncbi:MAG: S24/S26 family peptidase [Anaerolineales bacterium]|nr:S24/S26 family peptidase [Anaerolineales bacterium]
MTQPRPSPAHYGPAVIRLWQQTGQRKTITVHGHSMQPLLRPGDRLTVACGVTTFRRGDLVVFYRQQQLVVHRAVRLNRSTTGLTLVTKGDNALRCDAPLTINQVVGRVSGLSRGGQTVSIDRPGWRGVNHIIACLSLGSGRLVIMGARLKRRFCGRGGNPAPPFIRLASGRLLRLGLHLMGLMMWRTGR